MLTDYKIIYGDKAHVYTSEIIEKKSKFLVHVKKVETEEEAVAFIQQIKKKHYDANHNCSAFIVGKKKELVRSSDDGEPSGTAGKPMLEVLLGSGLVDVVAVVTRYFGGQLLGTGGLVRAYTQATQEGLACCQTAVMRLGKRVQVTTDYMTIGKILNELTKRQLVQEASDYTERIVLTLVIPAEQTEDFMDTITELSAGKSTVEIVASTYFPDRT